MSNNLRSIPVLRLANECMVGQYPDRVVPTFVFHQFAHTLFKSDSELIKLVSSLAFNPQWSIDHGLKNQLTSNVQDHEPLKATIQGLLNPDRRLFIDKKTQRASDGSSNTFPLVASLIRRGGADEGLGRRCFLILKYFYPECLNELQQLLAPDQSRDPLTSFILALTGNQRTFISSAPNVNQDTEHIFTEFDKNCAEFLKNLILNINHAGRIYAIRDLEIGIQFIGLLQMTSGFIARYRQTIPNVFVYGGMPPGMPNDVRVRFASRSYSDWIDSIWRETGDQLNHVINSYSAVSEDNQAKSFVQKLRIALTQAKTSEKDQTLILSAISQFLEDKNDEWSIFDILEDPLLFPPSELARRVRSLGQSIGFTAPDRGEGAVRIVFDTTLLNVLIRGLLGSNSMNFEEFVTVVSKKFGLVFGPGADDSIISEFSGPVFADTYKLMLSNQDALQERLLRAGFARAYSDSHTEVTPYKMDKE